MTTLHIDLQDGFAGQPVAIRLDGREIYRKPEVRTDLRISRADGLDVEVADSGVTVEVEVGGRSTSIAADPRQAPYLAVNLGSDGQPAIQPSSEPFAYL